MKLIGSYACVAHAFAKFLSIFNIAEEEKGFFPHTFNRQEFWNYLGPIPHWWYYQTDNFSPSKHEEVFTWYNEQVRNQVLFDFKHEMTSYCHSNVQLLCLDMAKFRDVFKNLQNETIGVDPYHHFTITDIAFKHICCKNFLPLETIGVAPCPLKSNYSIKQILWLEYEIKKSGYYMHHARNGGEQHITLLTGH